jgi:hypothetical protein
MKETFETEYVCRVSTFLEKLEIEKSIFLGPGKVIKFRKIFKK